MAGLPIVPLLIAGGALLLLKKRSDEKSADLPSDQGDGLPSDQGEGIVEEDGPTIDAEEVVFDVSADLPRIETIDDYHKWEGIIETKDITWVGSIEYASADEGLEEIGKFVEDQLDQYGSVYGRTVDRADLDPDAKAAMEESHPLVQSGLSQLFAENPGLEMVVLFAKPQGVRKMSVFLLFDTASNEQESDPRITLFKDLLASKGIEGYVLSGYRGMSNPSTTEALKTFLYVTLPKKAGIALPSLEGSSD